jgi:lipopolysaccharide biosynthesis protein
MHLFYPDLWKELAGYVSNLHLPHDLYVNLVRGNPANDRLARRIQERFSGASVHESENRGRDIGGFLRLIDRVLKSGKTYDSLIVMHSKKTPSQTSRNGVLWRRELLRCLLGSPAQAARVAGLFAADPRLGMVGSYYRLYNVENMPAYALYHNKPIIDEYCRRFDLKSERSDFIAGTMFWVRAEPFLGFFVRHDPAALADELEAGDLWDSQGPTRTHSWERLFGYIITAQGYTIQGIQSRPRFRLLRWLKRLGKLVVRRSKSLPPASKL